MRSLLILGRQPQLGLAEVESLYGADKLRPVGDKVVMVDVDPCLLAFDRLGSSVKFAKVLTTLDTTNWPEIEKFLLKVSPGHSQTMPEGKMLLGLSVIDLDVKLKQIEATALTLKKAIRKTGRPVRVVPNKELELNSAQVIHNKLTSPTGWELLFIRDHGQTIIAQTVKVQDIEAYTRRDRGRPKRDARVGMLPPKLAQIIINLAVGVLPEESRQSICEIPPDEPIPLFHFGQVVLDPFCGTGVLLQEAALMGYDIYGSDIDKRMIDYTDQNLQWLLTQTDKITAHSADKRFYRLEAADATNHQWTPPPNIIASEAYLGRPFTTPPSTELLAQTVSDTNTIIKKFLQNIGAQIKSSTRLALAVPAWQVKPNQFKRIPLIDSLSELGYNRVKFEHVSTEDLIYYRPDQIVARQLLVLTKD